MKNAFGISEKSYNLILSVFEKCPQVETVIIFGSRAKGNFSQGSDIDLAIKGNTCSAELALELRAIINEQIPVPYSVDVLDYNSLDNLELKAHIDRVGLEFYKR
ncbi:MAG TPA: nucleotidyltransferase domain-containing protein [Chitinispirillaceae bacterium]|nr:nucleotidyltransferase domain-containing protein [Chitinispirillaceae bacterium]